MQICFFTDEYSRNLLPLTLTRPADDLRIGIFTIREKWMHHLNAKIYTRVCPDYLRNVFVTSEMDINAETVWINSQFLPVNELLVKVEQLDLGQALICGGRVVAAKADPIITGKSIDNEKLNPSDFNSTELDFKPESITYLWDLLSLNAQEIENDLNLTYLMDINKTKIPDHVTVSEPDNVFMAEGASIEAGCIILADKGSVYIGPGATVEAGSIIKGPVAICEGATVKMAARISDATTIGPVCKVGGEIMNAIFHSYSNKAHDGFVGNSIFGQWCNLGADTNTSNLKNNYSKVRLADWTSGTPSDEGVQFMGTVMGDHSKAAINTMLNTGTVCGICSNIFTSGFPPKYIPSFSWLGDGTTETYRLEKALEAMNAMMGRRNVELSDSYRRMIEHLFVEAVQS